MNPSSSIEKRFALQTNLYAVPIPFRASTVLGLVPGLPFFRASPRTSHGEPSSGSKRGDTTVVSESAMLFIKVVHPKFLLQNLDTVMERLASTCPVQVSAARRSEACSGPRAFAFDDRVSRTNLTHSRLRSGRKIARRNSAQVRGINSKTRKTGSRSQVLL